MTQQTVTNTDISPWGTQTLRLTAFPTPSAQVPIEPGWWAELIGQQPENRNLKPRMGGLQEEGTVEGGKLVLSIQPIRIDWLYLAIPDLQHKDEPFPSIGPFSESLSFFVPRMQKWLEGFPQVHRLAFGAVLNMPVDDRPSGYRKIAAYLPSIKLDPDNATDFSYQINRPRELTIRIPLKINRLSKWAILRGQITEINMNPESAALLPGMEQYACHLELDVNTVPNPKMEPLPGPLNQVFEELVILGREIATRGDIP